MTYEELVLRTIFTTWLEYRRVSFDHSQADIIRELNKTFNRQYTSGNISKWSKRHAAVPDMILQLIDSELADMYEWYFKNNVISGAVDFKKLALFFGSATKLAEK